MGRDRELVVVALSGGVDSAVAAALLVEQGRRVVGMTLRLYDARGTEASAGGRCCGPRDVEDARRVCAHLGIPFYVVDHEAGFRAAVIDDFVREYASGRTPNPCVRCNEHVKFGPLLRRARALGGEQIATGHYARLEGGAEGRPRLRRAVDPAKDQSYFLFATPVEDLERTIFPLGGMTKEEVRERARGFGLPNAEKGESQEICFVPDGDHVAFVERHAAVGGGEIVDEEGRVLGEHGGVAPVHGGAAAGAGGGRGGRAAVRGVGGRADAAGGRGGAAAGAAGDLRRRRAVDRGAASGGGAGVGAGAVPAPGGRRGDPRGGRRRPGRLRRPRGRGGAGAGGGVLRGGRGARGGWIR